MTMQVAYPQTMEAAKLGSLSVEEYLRGEPASEVRHEFVAGAVYAMAGASEEHNTIAGNIYSALRSFLRGKPCKVFMADMKVRLAVGGEELLYYPDVVVTCDPCDSERYYKKFPRILVEVLSPETERTDRREKLLAYTNVETVAEYVLVAQDRMEVTVLRRDAHWKPDIITQSSQQLTLPSINFSMAVSAVYDGVRV